MQSKKQIRLYCFSPPIMVATCIIELTLLAYTTWRYQFDKLTRLVIALLFFLATFQLAEFRVCRGYFGLAQWSHVGYAAITLLPPLGIHILYTISNRSKKPLMYAAYFSAFVFVGIFALTANSLTGHQCLGNYVMFQVNPSLTRFYGVYYYGWVLISMLLGIKLAEKIKDKRRKQALYGFVLGNSAFLIPTTTVNLLNHATLRGIPSIMCGFAVILAIVTVVWVMPRAGIQKSHNQQETVKP
jgi:hypothetical protein